MDEYLRMCLIVCPLIFFGAFVDSIAGGGGLITLPAYALAGLPPHMVLGTNKLVASCAAVTASAKYIRSGMVDFSITGYAIIGAVSGGIIGGKIAMMMPANAVRMVMLIAIPAVAIFMLVKRDFGNSLEPKKYSKKLHIAFAVLIGVVTGIYDGILGAGTGTFLIIAFTGVFGIDLLTGAACSKTCNTASNLSALFMFIINGQVYYKIAVPAIVCSVAGGFLGSRYTVKGGTKNVRKMMMVVLVLLFVKMIYDFVA